MIRNGFLKSASLKTNELATKGHTREYPSKKNEDLFQLVFI